MREWRLDDDQKRLVQRKRGEKTHTPAQEK